MRGSVFSRVPPGGKQVKEMKDAQAGALASAEKVSTRSVRTRG
jgi:hypothetical protein